MLSKKEIIEKINHIHPTLKINYIHKKFIEVEDKYGICIVQYHTLLKGNKPSISTAVDKTDYFKNRLKEAQPELSVIGQYVNSFTKIYVENKYGICCCFPSRLLSGVAPSIETAICKNTYFINQAKEIHGDKYDYSQINYKNSITKIVIVCKKHGCFLQSPSNHLKSGCLYCGHENIGGNWHTNDKNKNKFCYLYILKFEKHDEIFYKFGITINLNNRLSTLRAQVKNIYNISIIKLVFNTSEYCSSLEKRLKRIIKYKKLNYKPTVTFCGKNECFKVNF